MSDADLEAYVEDKVWVTTLDKAAKGTAADGRLALGQAKRQAQRRDGRLALGG